MVEIWNSPHLKTPHWGYNLHSPKTCLFIHIVDFYPKSRQDFYTMLNAYVSTEGKQFYISLRWNDTDPQKPRHVVVNKYICIIILCSLFHFLHHYSVQSVKLMLHAKSDMPEEALFSLAKPTTICIKSLMSYFTNIIPGFQNRTDRAKQAVFDGGRCITKIFWQLDDKLLPWPELCVGRRLQELGDKFGYTAGVVHKHRTGVCCSTGGDTIPGG